MDNYASTLRRIDLLHERSPCLQVTPHYDIVLVNSMANHLRHNPNQVTLFLEATSFLYSEISMTIGDIVSLEDCDGATLVFGKLA